MRVITHTIAVLSVLGGVLVGGGIAPFLYSAVYVLSLLDVYCLNQYNPGHPATEPTCRIVDSLNDKLALQQLSYPHTKKH
jgi:hypothetical protein